MPHEKPDTTDPTRIGMSTSHDQDIWLETVSAIKQSGIGLQDVIENFPLYLRRVNFAKTLSHILLFQRIISLPGCIVECGVFKGQSLLTFSKLADIQCAGDTLKRVIGFDTFEGFPELTDQDGAPDEKRDKVEGGWDASDFLPTLQSIVEIAQRDSFIPRFKRIELVKGDVCETIPEYVENNPGLRISLLHLDLDLFEPTLAALTHLYPLVVPGGLVVLDEYGMDGFPGESSAFDQYFGDNRPQLEKFPFISTPGGWFTKQG